jgi:hypothetical protein
MGNEDSNYKRQEDQQWRDSVQSRIVSLTDSEVTQNDRLDEIDGEIHALREMLDGKVSDRDDNGIKGDLHELARGLSELRMLMAPDHLGQGGVIARLKALERQAGIEEKTIENRWKFLTALAVAIVSAVALVLTNLDRLGPSIKKFWSTEVGSESRPPRKRTVKTNKQRRQRPAVKETPTEETDDGTPKEDLP